MNIKILALARYLMATLLFVSSSMASAQCKFFEDFSIVGDGTVIDPRSGLVWQRCSVGQEWDGSGCRGEATQTFWPQAMILARSNRFLGRSDWRVPSAAEFSSVLGDASQCANNDWLGGRYAASPLIATQVKPRYAGTYWSMSASATGGRTDEFLTADFMFGRLAEKAPGTYGCCNVKLVRGGVASETIEAAKEFSDLFTRYSGLIDPVIREQNARLAAEKALIDKQNAEASRKRRLSENEATVERLASALRCEEARSTVQSRPEDERPYFNYESCSSERTFRNVERMANPQAIYLAAVKYEVEESQSRAKALYLVVVEKFPNSPIAVKAAERLAALVDVRAAERRSREESRRLEQAADAARESARQSSRVQTSIEDARRAAGERAYNACRIEEDACYSRGGRNCLRSCGSLR